MICHIHFAIFIFTFSIVYAIPATPSYWTVRNTTQTHGLFRKAHRRQVTLHNPKSLLHSTSSATIRRFRHHPIQRDSSSHHPFHSRFSLTPNERQGLTFEYCCDNDDCAPGRQCDNGDTVCFIGSAGECRCIPPDGQAIVCKDDASCPDGEICALSNEEGYDDPLPLCISAAAAPSAVAFAPLNESAVLLSGEKCWTSAQCLGDRLCYEGATVFDSSAQLCATQTDHCICKMQPDPVPCDSDEQCETPGEVCAVFTGSEMRACVSKAFVEGVSIFTHQGLTGERCFRDQDCLAERDCLTITGLPCSGLCVCAHPNPVQCTSNDDCTRPLEVCAQSLIDRKQECVWLLAAKTSGIYLPIATPSPSRNEPSSSPTPSNEPVSSNEAPPSMSPRPSDDPTPTMPIPPSSAPMTASATPSGSQVTSEPSLEPTENPVCVDANSLSHFRSSELVYPEHVAARVLCDVNGSCATAGHMVQYRGSSMRMRSYCEMVGCVPSVIFVNSPRLRIGVRISTKTEGLLFTALAAKFDTFIEEVALRTALRLGL